MRDAPPHFGAKAENDILYRNYAALDTFFWILTVSARKFCLLKRIAHGNERLVTKGRVGRSGADN
jgi:hypothetical protein